jgi:uncharacterized membrane protein YfcA
MMALALLGLAVGLVMGLAGAGGGIVAVPGLVGLLGWSMQQAAPVALVAVAAGALVGTIDGLRRGLARWRAALLMAGVGVAFSALGLATARQVPEVWIKGVFSAVLLFTAYRLLASGNRTSEEQAELELFARARIHADTGRFVWNAATASLLAGAGAAAGFASGLLGVGGGFILVPLLHRFTELSIHGIVATSLMVIALISGGGAISALAQGAQLPMPGIVVFAAATVAGVWLGRIVAQRLPAETIRRGFGLLLIAVAIHLAAQALGL